VLYASPSRSGIQGIATDVEGVLLDPRERSLIDIDTHLK
jgi:peptide/nickel transport system substrate-binding protein